MQHPHRSPLLLAMIPAVLAFTPIGRSHGASSATHVSDPTLEIELRPIGPGEIDIRQLSESALKHPKVQRQIGGDRATTLVSGFLGDDGRLPAGRGEAQDLAGKHAPLDARPEFFRIFVFDYASDSLWKITPPLAPGLEPSVRQSDFEIEPTPREWERAADILGSDPQLGPAITRGELEVYPAMPPLIHKAGCGRTLAAGLLPHSSPLRHEIVGVDLSQETIVRFAPGAPPQALADAAVCGSTNAGQANTARGRPGSAELIARQGEEELWRMTLIRPAASSGEKGSGIDLVDIRYKGRLVLARAHAPIMNVDYAGNACGPYRDWLYNENPFQAEGALLAPGILKAQAKPVTIADNGDDRGNFRGVAVHEDNGELVLTSELAATWYRYVAEVRFAPDGTIRPTYRFGAVTNSCVCRRHVHHVYWRFDFDVDGRDGDSLSALMGGAWEAIGRERMFRRGSGAGRAGAWRVSDRQTGQVYELVPGPDDGQTNSYGGGDAWALRFRRDELDDREVRRTRTRAGLRSFVNAERINETDLVFWYAAHYTHDQNDASTLHEGVTVGPAIRPLTAP